MFACISFSLGEQKKYYIPFLLLIFIIIIIIFLFVFRSVFSSFEYNETKWTKVREKKTYIIMQMLAKQ